MNSFQVDFPAKLLASDAECICVLIDEVFMQDKEDNSLEL